MQSSENKHRNIFLVGPMGVGKTTIGRMLANELKLTFKDSDQELEKRTGADIPWIFDVEGEAGFREREAKIIDELTQESDVLIATGGGAVLREDNRRHLMARGTVVFLDTTLEMQLKRLSKDKKRPLLQNQDHRKVLSELKEKRDPIYQSVCDFKVMVSEQNSRKVVNQIKRELSARGLISRGEEGTS